MHSVRRQISLSLALVMVFSSLLNVVLVECLAGVDHHEIELITHQLDGAALASHPDHPDGPRPDLHPDGCQDSSLVADSATQRPGDGRLPMGDATDLPGLLPIRPAGAESLADSGPPRRLGPTPTAMRRPAIDWLAAVRLLI